MPGACVCWTRAAHLGTGSRGEEDPRGGPTAPPARARGPKILRGSHMLRAGTAGECSQPPDQILSFISPKTCTWGQALLAGPRVPSWELQGKRLIPPRCQLNPYLQARDREPAGTRPVLVETVVISRLTVEKGCVRRGLFALQSRNMTAALLGMLEADGFSPEESLFSSLFTGRVPEMNSCFDNTF